MVAKAGKAAVATDQRITEYLTVVVDQMAQVPKLAPLAERLRADREAVARRAADLHRTAEQGLLLCERYAVIEAVAEYGERVSQRAEAAEGLHSASA